MYGENGCEIQKDILWVMGYKEVSVNWNIDMSLILFCEI